MTKLMDRAAVKETDQQGQQPNRVPSLFYSGATRTITTEQSQPQPLLRQILRNGHFQFWRWTLSLGAMRRHTDFEGCGDRRIEVAPDQVAFDASSYWSQKNQWTQENPPRLLGGNWDQPENLESMCGPLLASFRRHFFGNVKWTETDFYQILIQRIDEGQPAGGPRTRDELAQWLNHWDELGHQLVAVNDPETTAKIPEDWPEVPLAIGRDGRLAALANAPVVAMASVFGVKQIPCRVVLRHPQWMKFCREFLCYSETLHEGRPYQPCTHVDLAGLSSSWSEQRFRIIQECLKDGSGRLMDIGANLGYFCHCAEGMGYDCVAVDPCPKLAYFTEKLKLAENKQFEVLCASILEHPFHESYDVILALNIFHHFIKKADRHHQFVAMLGRMRTREMIFQSHKPGESQMTGVYRDYSPEEFVQFILDHSCLKTAEYIGSDQGRPLFRLRAV